MHWLTHNLKTVAILSITAFAVGMMPGCEKTQDSDSETQSLSNLARRTNGDAEDRSQRCSGDHKVNAGIPLEKTAIVGYGENSALLGEASKALTSIPSSLSFIFFEMGGKIQFVDPATLRSQCGAPPSGSSSADGCLVLDVETTPVIYSLPNASAVHLTITRSFGAFYSKAANFSVESGRIVKRDQVDPETIAQLDRVKKAVLSDIRGGELAKSGLAAKVEAVAPLEIYPEAFDSLYCSTVLKASEKKKFPTAIPLLDQEAALIQVVDDELASALETGNLEGLRALENDARFKGMPRNLALIAGVVAEKHINSFNLAGGLFGAIGKGAVGAASGVGAAASGVGRFLFGGK